MKATIKDIYLYFEGNENTGFIFPSASSVTYPTIQGNTSNFLSDYELNKEELDRMFLIDYSGRTYSEILNDSVNIAGLYTEWKDSLDSILYTYLDSWARLYYALSLKYNPLYNVDGSETISYSQRLNTDALGARLNSTQYGARTKTDVIGNKSASDTIGQKETTDGSRSDTTTNYSVSFDSTTEKETGKSTDSIGSQTITEGAQSNSHTEASYTDTHTDASVTDTTTINAVSDTHTQGAYTETHERSGNIGVTMSQQLLEAEWNFRKHAFFKDVFHTIVIELGCYYE